MPNTDIDAEDAGRALACALRALAELTKPRVHASHLQDDPPSPDLDGLFTVLAITAERAVRHI